MKKIKAWAVIGYHRLGPRGGIIGLGWGSSQMWVFKNKYEAIDEIKSCGNNLPDNIEIVKVQILFPKKPTKKK